MSKFHRCDRCKDEIPASEIRFLDRSKEREGKIDETFELCYSCDAMLTTFLSGESIIIVGAVAVSEHQVQAGTQMAVHRDAFATTMAPLSAPEVPQPGDTLTLPDSAPPQAASAEPEKLLDDDIPF
jgi:hypothetical protein